MMGATIFDGTHSVRLLIRYTDPTVSAFQVSLDSLYVGVDQPILLDDFEAGSTCRWSATVNDPN